jgi:hypothetical protein
VSVARCTSIRLVISIVAEMGWKIHQMDVKTIFEWSYTGGGVY